MNTPTKDELNTIQNDAINQRYAEKQDRIKNFRNSEYFKNIIEQIDRGLVEFAKTERGVYYTFSDFASILTADSIQAFKQYYENLGYSTEFKHGAKTQLSSITIGWRDAS